MANCAKKGTPSGGPLDSIPPVIVRSIPENYTTNFEGDEIRIYFDEYIKLKDLQKNLIISPPLKYSPVITPISTSKMLKIKILDTLQENTTYSFNFGKSIVDNNQENEFEYFKYVFSTGSYIDSLKVSGRVLDAELPVAEFPVTVLMYEVKDQFRDSLIYTQKPMYIAATRDSSNTFEITNVKAGEYLLLALKEPSNDYTFQPKTDKIGFTEDFVTLPTDSTYTITLFKEKPEYTIGRPAQLSKYHIIFGYEGETEDLDITPLSSTPDGFEAMQYRDVAKDSLHYWFKPEVTADSLLFLVRNADRTDTVEVRMKNLYPDSLTVAAYRSGTMIPTDTLMLRTSTPLIQIEDSAIKVINRDSAEIAFSTRINPVNNLAEIVFRKEDDQRYTVDILPGAFTDFYEAKSDSLQYVVQTNAASDYGTLNLSLRNIDSYPLIVELLTERYKVADSKYKSDLSPVYFEYIKPGNYFIRIIFDENQNGRWDTGNFLQRTKPERIVYFPVKLEVRANWSLNETFTLD